MRPLQDININITSSQKKHGGKLKDYHHDCKDCKS